MRKSLLISVFLFTLSIMPGYSRSADEVISGIVPAPRSAVALDGSFDVRGAAVRCDINSDVKTQAAAAKFADALSAVTGKTSRFSATGDLRKGICFVLKSGYGPEAYKINISKKAVTIEASERAGFLYAIQTLKQMLPVAVYGTQPAVGEDWTLPCCEISDEPRYSYRGMLLDSGRHFFEVKDILRYLDVMAIYKLNRFHWHLTEDQGWRIEIKKYPRLTEVGAYRSGTQIGKDRSSSDGIPHGGFYTQDQIRQIVAYADALGITIVPEVDMPGHMLAALASYPELGFEASKPYNVWTRWGVCHKVLNVGKDETVRFAEDVVDEVADLFPGEYFCIGGDECPMDEWKDDPYCQQKIKELGFVSDEKTSAEQRLQSHFMSHMQKYLTSKGKKVLGADELLAGEVEPGTIIMNWRGLQKGRDAASKGIDVMFVPKAYCFMDFYQLKDESAQPLAIGGYTPFSKCYKFNPSEGLDAQAASHIKGLQIQMWTEYVKTPEHIEYMLFPRLFALSEVQWCVPEVKDFERLCESVDNHQLKILELLGYNYCKVRE